MGLSCSISWNIQLIAGMGQMLTKDNSEIIYYRYSIYMCDDERVISFQPTECELPYE